MDDDLELQPNHITLGEMDSVIEPFPPYHQIEWLYNRRIVVFSSVGNASRDVVDKWVQMITQVSESWPSGKPYLMIVDLSKSNSRATISPYQRTRVGPLFQYRNGPETYVAYILPDTFVAKLIRIYVMHYAKNQAKMQFFYNRESAIMWLFRASSTKL